MPAPIPTTTLWPGLNAQGASLTVYAEDQATLITSAGAVVTHVQEYPALSAPYVLPKYYRDLVNAGRLSTSDPLDLDGVPISLSIPAVEVGNAPSAGQYLRATNASQALWSTAPGGGGGSGDVVGPASAVDNRLTRFDGTTGKLVQQSVVALDDSGNLTGLASITLSGNIVVSGTVDGRDVSALGATVDSLVAGGGSGDVVGPSSATDNRLTRFDGTTGKLIQQSLVTVDDSGNVSGVAALSMSGSITVSGTVDGRDVSTDGATLDGYATSKANRSLTIETVTGTTYTLVLADAQEKLKAFSSASPKTVTVPPNSSVAFAVGAVVPLYQSGAGLMTVAQGAGATVRPPRGGTLVADGQYAYLTLVKVATDEWKLLGEAAAA